MFGAETVSSAAPKRLTAIAAAVVVAVVTAACTRHDVVGYVPPSTATLLTVSNVQGLEAATGETIVFDRVEAEIKGVEWSVIATVSADFSSGKATLALPSAIASDRLCKAARDGYNDYTGFWPAANVSERSAGVAGLGDIVAIRDGKRVGRLYLSDWDGVPANKYGACFVYFCYQDRPYTLSGYNLAAPGSSTRFFYDASFTRGWNPYYHVYNGQHTKVTTDKPGDKPLVWRFERW